jgi:fructose-bisphosphate aldolase class I
LTIGPQIPSRTCIEANAHALARFAALSQEAGLVPIVEPEVLMDGTHTIERHLEVTEATLVTVFNELFTHHVKLEGMLLKPNMVLSGKESPHQASIDEVADATVYCMRRTVPPAVPGIMFLSGGQTDIQATRHLNALNRRAGTPWQLSFSFGRALQAAALSVWRGERENVPALQKALLHRARCNAAARAGKYSEELEHRLSS